MDDKKDMLHVKSWDIYFNQNENFNGGYLVYVFGSNGNKVLWEVVDDYVVEEGSGHDEIGLWGFKS